MPIEVVVEGNSPEDGDDPIFSVTIEPEYCQHGVLENIAVQILNDDGTAGVHFNICPPNIVADHGEDDDAGDDPEEGG